MNNREWSKMKEFQDFCKHAGVEPTKRQASKFRAKKGLAYRAAKKQFPKGKAE